MEKQFPEPRIRTSKTAYTVWMLPILALAIGVWLVYKNYVDAGIRIHIAFPDATGIVAKKTMVKFKGMEVGRVNKLKVLEDGSGVLAEVEIAKETLPYLTDKLQFWLVKPNVGFGGISGLDTLFSGAYIQVNGDEEVKSGNSTRLYRALIGKPPVEIPKGLEVYKLFTNNAAGVNPGSLVYHRQIEVGSIRGVQLSDDHQTVEVTLSIEPKFKGLVKQSSRFWNISGISATMGFDGVKVESQGVAAMLIGGIAFSSPAGSKNAEPLSEFRLYEDAEAARDSLEIELNFSIDADVKVGTPIYLDQQQVGKIDSLNWKSNFAYLVGKANLSVELETLMRNGSQFWLDKPSLSLNNINVGQLLKGTIIRLNPGTGQHSIEFDVLDERPYDKWAKNGLHLTIKAADAYGIEKGTDIYYQNKVIGEVQWVDFDVSSRQFRFDLLIYPTYEPLIDEETLFYHLGGVNFDASLEGIKLNMPSVKQLVSGGIGVHLSAQSQRTIDPTDPADPTDTKAPVAQLKSRVLYQNLTAALAQLDSGMVTYQLHSQGLESPSVGSPINYKQFTIGKVVAVALAKDAQYSKVSVAVDRQYASLIRQNTRFYIQSSVAVQANLQGIKIAAAPLKSMLFGGITMTDLDPNVAVGTADQVYQLYGSQRELDMASGLVRLHIKPQTSLNVGAPVKYRQYVVGEVVDVHLATDLSTIEALVKFKPSYLRFFNRQDSRYWLVQANTRLSEIKNLANTILGDSLAVDKGEASEQQSVFQVIASNLSYRQGVVFSLEADQLGSLDVGAPILFKQLTVGEVTNVRLRNDSQRVVIGGQIYPQYRHLLTTKSRFWNASGISIDAGLFSGIKIDTQTMATILDGGIAMATVLNDKPASENSVFELYLQPEADWQDGIIGQPE